ncbi:MAG: class I SAM-dependent methyltransferase [Acidobacteria bacterium]|nr:class I SAM-dependent methyltransferase [Acidobacteriota bacterium]
MLQDLNQVYERDRAVWNSCARTYEEQIVGGHPDVTAYEEFEEDLLDRILLHLIRDRKTKVRLYDVGCGSGRLHLRYALKSVLPASLPYEERSRIRSAQRVKAGYVFDSVLSHGLESIGGVDFSAEMLELARRKLRRAGLGTLLGNRLFLDQGSAFDLPLFSPYPLPFLVTVCNSIGVMQGPKGAEALFRSMCRAVEGSGGIALISSYRKEAIQSFALSNYESTMNVCGQPRWLRPDSYADARHILVPQAYKRAYDPSGEILVDVFNRKGQLLHPAVALRRDPSAVDYAIRTGHIRTYSDYESYWYSWDQIQAWMDTLWPKDRAYHLEGCKIDSLRAGPVQLAVLDAGNHLKDLVQRWSV